MTRMQTLASKARGVLGALAVLFVVLSVQAAAPAVPPGETMAERSLKKIVERQKEVFATATKQGDNLDEGSMQQQLQSVMHDYERLLRSNPNFAAAYAAYGYFLTKVDMRKEATVMLMKANQLDPDIALVKNQLGNALAEDGK